MRHQKSGRALGVKPAHRRAMLRNLVTSVLEHEQITTTMARAKELRGPLDKMITLGKKGDLNARRKALTFVKSKKAMEVLFGEFATRYADRPGGFSRLVRMSVRRGDGAEMALVQLVGAPNDAFAAAEKPKPRRGGRRRGAAEPDAASEKKGRTKDEKQAETAEEQLSAGQPEQPAGEEETSSTAQAGAEQAPEDEAAADRPPAEAGETPAAKEAVTEEKVETGQEAAEEAGAAADPPKEPKEEERKD